MLSDRYTAPVVWQEFRPRPFTVAPFKMVFRLFWNPDRNEELFVVSCAERIQQHPAAHSINEIRRRIQFDIEQMQIESGDEFFQFRLVFVNREQTNLVQEVLFVSDAFPILASKT